jgi:hypothetical protein
MALLPTGKGSAFAAFAASDRHRSLRQVHVVDVQIGRFRSTHSRGIQQFQNRAVSHPRQRADVRTEQNLPPSLAPSGIFFGKRASVSGHTNVADGSNDQHLSLNQKPKKDFNGRQMANDRADKANFCRCACGSAP